MANDNAFTRERRSGDTSGIAEMYGHGYSMANAEPLTSRKLEKASLLSANKGLAAVLTFAFAVIFTIVCASWPDIYGFVQPHPTGHPRTLGSVPVRLSDDVMISLRSGYIFQETGIPAFNRGDLAQPSTSYLAPYLFAFLLKVSGTNISVVLYALIGLISVALTAATIVLFSRSTMNAVLLVLALLLTTTNLAFALNGWDHLFQGFFLALAAAIAFTSGARPSRVFAVSLLLALGTLFRPDGLVISIGILVVLYLSSTRMSQFIVFGVVPYLVLVGTALAVNFRQFGYLTPTTTRLKFGSAPSFRYIGRYIAENGALSYSALTLLTALAIFYFAFRHTMPGARHYTIVICCGITALIALYNSDFFSAARMLWTPACVLATVIAISSPALFDFEMRPSEQLTGISPIYRGLRSPWGSQYSAVVFRAVLAMLLISVAAGTLFSLITQRARDAIISRSLFYTSPTAQQYVISQWIGDNLKPEDGSIGFFFLGVSYDLPRFEIADFLGKADESIASSKVKTGPPGHNKWDIDKTLHKWKPQAIVPAGPTDPTLPETRENSRRHSPDLSLNNEISTDFVYCYVPDSVAGIPDKWGFFLRKNIAALHSNQLKCSLSSQFP